jgi:hypothetical protein
MVNIFKLKSLAYLLLALPCIFVLNAKADDTCYTPEFNCHTDQEGYQCNRKLNKDTIRCCCKTVAGTFYGYYDYSKLMEDRIKQSQEKTQTTTSVKNTDTSVYEKPNRDQYKIEAEKRCNAMLPNSHPSTIYTQCKNALIADWEMDEEAKGPEYCKQVDLRFVRCNDEKYKKKKAIYSSSKREVKSNTEASVKIDENSKESSTKGK